MSTRFLSFEPADLGPVFSSVQCSVSGNAKWIDRFPGRVVSVVGNAMFCAIGVDNGDLYITSLSGRRLFPCIGVCTQHFCGLAGWCGYVGVCITMLTSLCLLLVPALGSSLSLLECSPKQSPYLLVILVSGVLKVWHVGKRQLTLSESIETITNVADPSDSHRLTLLRCHVTVKGQPILTFAKSHPESKGMASTLLSYTFDLSMGCWWVYYQAMDRGWMDGRNDGYRTQPDACALRAAGCGSQTTALCSQTLARHWRRTQSSRRTFRYETMSTCCCGAADSRVVVADTESLVGRSDRSVGCRTRRATAAHSVVSRRRCSTG